MTQSTTMKIALFLEKPLKVTRSSRSGHWKWVFAAQLILMLVTVVLSDTQSVSSDSEVLSHSISHPISSDNKNVPFKDTQQHTSINLTKVWDGVQKFIQSGVNSTTTFLDLSKRDVDQQTHKKQEGSHEPGQHRVNNHTLHENVTHDTMHEHVLHHHDVGEIQEDSNHEFTTQDENPAETVRLQDILRQIFVDELDSDEHTAEEIDNGEQTLNDGRSEISGRNATKKTHANSYANSTVSRQGRADSNNRTKRRFSKSTSKSSSSKSKSTDLSKYNKYMDAVLQRMNTMIKSKRMDPLRVNLYAGPSKKKNGNKNKKNSPRNLESEEDDGFDTDEEADGDREPPSDGPATRDIYLDRDGATRRIRALLANVSSTTKPLLLLSEQDEERNFDSVESRDGSPSTARNSPDNGTKPLSTGRNKSKPSTKKNSKENGQKAKGGNKSKNSPRPTRGILHGLSTLRRDGNVQVLKQSDRSRLVRAKFLLGPVALEILPKKTNPRTGRGGQGNKPAATATAPQLKGILEVRLKQGSPTRIKRLRVYPPGNVKVAGEGAKQAGPSGGRVTGRGYNKVTPMATYRLRQVAMQVVRHADRLKH